MNLKKRRWLIAVLLVALLGTGLTAVAAAILRSPEMRKARHLQRGDQYFSEQKYREASIEYRNVLQVEAGNVRAIQQLALAYYQLGDVPHAMAYLVKWRERDPDSPDARLKLGTISLLARRMEEARAEAAFVLNKDPKNLDAFVLMAGAATKPAEIDAAVRRLEAVREDFRDRAPIHLALGSLYLRKRDLASAERSFRDGVATEPKSVDAHMALADFYIVKRDLQEAEREYRQAAGLSPVGSPARLRVADFYLATGKADEAKRMLAELTTHAPDFLPAWRRLAEVTLAEGKYEESEKALGVVLKKNHADLQGRLLRGRLHLAKRQTQEAIQEFRRVLTLEPRLTEARYQVSLAHLQAGNLQSARVELRQAIDAEPTFTDAILLLAELDIQTRATQAAIDALEKIIATRPNEARAYLLLGSAYMNKREPARAVDAYRRVAALAPKDPRGPYLVGLAQRAMGRPAEAKPQFEAALALAPGYVEPLAQLVSLALADKQPDAALERVGRQIARVPKSAPLHHLLGGLHVARREAERAEAAYLKALELDPNLAVTYVALGQLYVASGKNGPALSKLNEGLKVDPNSLVALMLVGVIQERMGDIPKAQQAYERVLGLNPRFAPAANNLAYLYSEHGGDKEKALQLAQTAKEAAPDDPAISDTLGWILYQRGVYQRALSLLKESAAKLQDNPEVQYHLGMAYAKVGDKESAGKALRRALQSPSFPRKDEVQKALAELRVGS